ncbi:glutathione S-transferase [Cordyceps militaris CM01]|uniref:Glutathione S-transferase n=1 Tax=Cordyceps militaris (strain CM01) TaxID=983644 RepID=G3JTZ6_CORMM|nr:glutathione S-transferase [Cordyceps militaris CM01]EGX88150.1 glutathione S-transferase [Cordyceps militaris CM01]
MSLIKFYRADYSTAGITDAVLQELEAAVGRPLATRIDVALRSGTRAPEFLAVNPNGFVPALVLPDDPAQPLWESAAITMYLGEAYGVDAGLYPASAGAARAHAVKWIVWSNVNLPLQARQVSRVVHCQQEEQDEGVRALREKDAEVAREELRKLLGVLDGGLQDRPYLLGETYSLADTHIWAFMTYIKMLKVDMEGLTNLTAWIERVGAREQLKGL